MAAVVKIQSFAVCIYARMYSTYYIKYNAAVYYTIAWSQSRDNARMCVLVAICEYGEILQMKRERQKCENRTNRNNRHTDIYVQHALTRTLYEAKK